MPIVNGLLKLNELILVNSIIADGVVIETSWPMLKFADNLAINLVAISDAIRFKLKHFDRKKYFYLIN